jgi:hypothetical protein
VVQYATASDLASYLQQDVDTATADLVLQMASDRFSLAAATWFTPMSVTYTTTGTVAPSIRLPFRPVRSVSAVRVNGVAVTGWTLVKNTLWRPAGFGTACRIPPDEVEIDLSHGEDAGAAYAIPVAAVAGESIDDYQVRYSAAGGGMQLTRSAMELAAQLRGTFAA